MPGIDKPTGRVVALIVLLIVLAAALRGYLPARDQMTHAQPGGGRAAMLVVVVLLSATLTLLAVAVIARLRDPRAVAPSAGNISDMLGTGKGRPSWRVLLIGLGVLIGWLVIAMLLARWALPHHVNPVPDAAAVSGHPAPPGTATQPPRHQPHHDSGDMLGLLLASGVPMLLLIVAGAITTARRRSRTQTPGILLNDDVGPGAPVRHSESLARAAELGLAEMIDPNHEPREAIIACYAAMERELAHVPGAAPQEFDTPTEVLARAVEHHALHADNAIQLVQLFEEARFSPHVMNERHREVAVQVLELVLAELRSLV